MPISLPAVIIHPGILNIILENIRISSAATVLLLLILTGKETNEELEKLADDVYQYFGLGCRNVTKIYVRRTMILFPCWSHLRNITTWLIIINTKTTTIITLPFTC